MFRKIASSVVAAVVLMGAMAAQARAQAEKDNVYPEQLQKAYMESVVRIKADKGEIITQGSGVCVAYNTEMGVAVILTAAHVVKNARSLSFEVFTSASYPNPAGKSTPQAKWWWNEKDDIAIIAARLWVPRTASLAKNPDAIREGDHVFSVGCGIGAPPVAQVGNITRFDESGDYVVDRGAIGGRSGGPLIGAQGVIGIVSRGRNGETLFVSLDKIHGLMERTAAMLKNGQ
jgi:hypothetical protein